MGVNGFAVFLLRSWGIIKKCTPFEPLHERSAGCAFRIRIGHYFQKRTASHGGAVFLHEWTRTRGRLETCRRHVSTRGGLRRSAGRVPPPAPKKDSVPRGRCIFFVLLPSDRAGHGQNGGAGGDRPKSGSCILRVDRGRNGDAACCRGKDAGCGVIAVVSGLGPRVAV